MLKTILIITISVLNLEAVETAYEDYLDYDTVERGTVSGELAAAWVCDADLPSYAKQLSLARFEDARLMNELRSGRSKGIL
jgi:hypothetical protein